MNALNKQLQVYSSSLSPSSASSHIAVPGNSDEVMIQMEVENNNPNPQNTNTNVNNTGNNLNSNVNNIMNQDHHQHHHHRQRRRSSDQMDLNYYGLKILWELSLDQTPGSHGIAYLACEALLQILGNECSRGV
jgi:hypothetical protein